MISAPAIDFLTSVNFRRDIAWPPLRPLAVRSPPENAEKRSRH
jgi:hypothetical protein